MYSIYHIHMDRQFRRVDECWLLLLCCCRARRRRAGPACFSFGRLRQRGNTVGCKDNVTGLNTRVNTRLLFHCERLLLFALTDFTALQGWGSEYPLSVRPTRQRSVGKIWIMWYLFFFLINPEVILFVSCVYSSAFWPHFVLVLCALLSLLEKMHQTGNVLPEFPL